MLVSDCSPHRQSPGDLARQPQQSESGAEENRWIATVKLAHAKRIFHIPPQHILDKPRQTTRKTAQAFLRLTLFLVPAAAPSGLAAPPSLAAGDCAPSASLFRFLPREDAPPRPAAAPSAAGVLAALALSGVTVDAGEPIWSDPVPAGDVTEKGCWKGSAERVDVAVEVEVEGKVSA